MITTETPAIELPPLAASAKPLPEEATGWPNYPYFFRRFPGGLAHAERYLCLMPSRLALVNLSYDSLGTPVGLFSSNGTGPTADDE